MESKQHQADEFIRNKFKSRFLIKTTTEHNLRTICYVVVAFVYRRRSRTRNSEKVAKSARTFFCLLFSLISQLFNPKQVACEVDSLVDGAHAEQQQ